MVPVFVQPPQLPPGVQMPQATIQVTLVVLLKSGGLGGGKYGIRIKANSPTGKPLPDNQQSVFFNGGEDNGALLGIPVVLAAPEEGLYWFDVYFEDALLTRVPLRVLYQQAVHMPFHPGSGQ